MIKRIKQIGIVIMVLVIFFSTTGISLYIHFCSCLNTTNYTFFPEFIKNKNNCCCEEKNNNTDNVNLYNFQNNDCCKNKHLLYKLNTYLIPLLLKITEKISFPLLFCYESEKLVYAIFSQTDFNKLYTYYFPPPHLYGKILLLFIHHIKIPLPV